jgi:hypothetical protein
LSGPKGVEPKEIMIKEQEANVIPMGIVEATTKARVPVLVLVLALESVQLDDINSLPSVIDLSSFKLSELPDDTQLDWSTNVFTEECTNLQPYLATDHIYMY